MKRAMIGGIGICTAIVAAIAWTGAGHEARAQAATPPKQLVTFPISGAIQVGTITTVGFTAMATGYSLNVMTSNNSAVCTIMVANLNDALQLRAQILSEKTTKVTCRNDKTPAGAVVVASASPPANGQSVELTATP